MTKSKAVSKRQEIQDSLRKDFEEAMDARQENAPEPASLPFPKAVPDLEPELVDNSVSDALVKETMSKLDEVVDEDVDDTVEVNPDGLAMFQTFKDDLTHVIAGISDSHFDYFLGGVILTVHSSSLGCLILGSMFIIPNLILAQHTNWFQTLDFKIWVYLLAMISFSLLSNVYAVHYISMAF